MPCFLLDHGLPKSQGPMECVFLHGTQSVPNKYFWVLGIDKEFLEGKRISRLCVCLSALSTTLVLKVPSVSGLTDCRQGEPSDDPAWSWLDLIYLGWVGPLKYSSRKNSSRPLGGLRAQQTARLGLTNALVY